MAPPIPHYTAAVSIRRQRQLVDNSDDAGKPERIKAYSPDPCVYVYAKTKPACEGIREDDRVVVGWRMMVVTGRERKEGKRREREGQSGVKGNE